MIRWHTRWIATGGPFGLVHLFTTTDGDDHLNFRGAIELTAPEYEDLAARLAGDTKQLLAHLEELVESGRLPARSAFVAVNGCFVEPGERHYPDCPRFQTTAERKRPC